MLEVWTDSYGIEWLSSESLTAGDYAGSASIGAANIEWLEQQRDISVMPCNRAWASGMDKRIKWYGGEENFCEYDVIVLSEPFNTKKAFINSQTSNARLLEAVYALESYPVFDDEKLSEIESRWENEMWHDWLMDELISNASRFFPGIERYFSRQDLSTGSEMESLLWGAYMQAREETNTDPIPEGLALWIDVERLCKPFGALVLDALRSYHKKRWYIKTLAMRNRMCFLPGMENLKFTMNGNIPR